MKLIKLGIILGFLGLLLIPFGLAGAANTGIQISPVTFNFEVNPGATETGKITITNRNDEAMDYVMEVENFSNSSEDGAPTFSVAKPGDGVSSFSSWVTFPAGDKGSIAVGKSAEVSFLITVPATAEPGGHYGAIFAKQTKPLIQGENQVGVATRVGSLALVSVPGETVKSASIKEFQIPKFIWKGPAPFKLRVENTGTVHYDSKGVAEIKNTFGSIVSLDMGTHTVLPKSIRAYEATWQTKYPIGYYQVTPTATDGDKGIVRGDTVGVIAIPLIIVIPILIVLILLIILISYLRRHVRFVGDRPEEKKEEKRMDEAMDEATKKEDKKEDENGSKPTEKDDDEKDDKADDKS